MAQILAIFWGNGGYSQHDPPLIRLQVWCYMEEGRSLSVNSALAKLLNRAKIDEWDIWPVEFKYQQSSDCDFPTNAEESLRKLFRVTLPSLIDEFSKPRGIKLHQVAMFPVGDTISQDFKQRYSHLKVHHSLAMKHSTVANVGTIEENRVEVIAQIVVRRTIATIVPEAVAAGFDTYLELKQKIFESKEEEGGPMTNALHSIKAIAEATGETQDNAPKQLVKYGSGTDLCATPEMNELWNNVLEKTDRFRMLVGDMQECANRISKGSAVGNEDLYNILIKVNDAMSALSSHREKLKELGILFRKQHGDRGHALWARVHTSSIYLVLGILVATGGPLLPIFTGAFMAAGTVVAIGATVADAIDIKNIITISGEKAKIGDLDDLVLQLETTLGGVQIAALTMFCEEVLNIPLDLMSIQERRGILQEFGVDVNELKNGEYRKELVRSRIEQFCFVFKKLEEKRKEIGKDFGITDAKCATNLVLAR
ncbi:hypothetical protein VE03_01809 [Pseudogymnoascus sp. 23342-1-I1]|nr:hypothetical protein VE03_01809 [Pseudogymnoascus sp. 23342-1-I1]